MLELTILSPEAVIFAGRVHHLTVPGEQGVFEILPFHRPIVSRLLPGLLVVDEQCIAILRGVIKVEHDQITAIVEPDPTADPPTH